MSDGEDGAEEPWLVTQSRVDLPVMHRAGKGGEGQCLNGRLRKYEGPHFGFPTICRRRQR